MEVRPEITFQRSAFERSNPEWSKTIKSPTSWGISWAKIASAVTQPRPELTMNALAIKMPSVKLWNASPIKMALPAPELLFWLPLMYSEMVCSGGFTWLWCWWLKANSRQNRNNTLTSSVQPTEAAFSWISNASGSKWVKATVNNKPAEIQSILLIYRSRNLKLISPAKTMDRTDDKRVAARICKRVVISFLLRDD